MTITALDAVSGKWPRTHGASLFVHAAAKNHIARFQIIGRLLVYLLCCGIRPFVVDPATALGLCSLNDLLDKEFSVSVLCPAHVLSDKGWISTVSKDFSGDVNGEDVEILINELSFLITECRE